MYIGMRKYVCYEKQDNVNESAKLLNGSRET